MTFQAAGSAYPQIGAPGSPTGVNQFGDPNRPGAFAGSYFDYLGPQPGQSIAASVSDPRNFYMQGLPGPVGIARADGPVRTERFGVPPELPSFRADGPAPSTYQTESEYQEENQPSLGDIFLDAGEDAAGAFLDTFLEDLIQGIGSEIMQ
jgi:hypothetical protein